MEDVDLEMQKQEVSYGHPQSWELNLNLDLRGSSFHDTRRLKIAPHYIQKLVFEIQYIQKAAVLA